MQAQQNGVVQFPVQKNRLPTARSRKAPKKSRLIRLLVVGVLIGYLLWAGTQLAAQERRMRDLAGRYAELSAKQETLIRQNSALEEQIEKLLHDPRYIEQLAREMGMVKPDDTVYVPADRPGGP